MNPHFHIHVRRTSNLKDRRCLYRYVEGFLLLIGSTYEIEGPVGLQLKLAK